MLAHLICILYLAKRVSCEMQECQALPEDISHYAEEFTVVTTVRALTNCDFFVLDAEAFQQVMAEFPRPQEELLQAAIRCSSCCRGYSGITAKHWCCMNIRSALA